MKIICEAKFLSEVKVFKIENFVEVSLEDVLKKLNTIELLKEK